MKKALIGLLSLMAFGFMAIVPIFAQTATNMTTECVTDYDTTVDYFPNKVELTDAENFTVDYYNNYKVVTVTDAFDGATPFTYILVQCGTSAPDAANFPDNTQFVEVPVGNIIAMSTTQLPHLSALGLMDRLIGLDTFLFVSSPEVIDLINAGELLEVGGGSGVNVELVLDAEPDLVMTFGFNPDTDAHPVLLEAGIFTAVNAEWREDTPLGRAEWIKYVSLFFNAEAAAEDAYTNIVTEYDAVRELAASVPVDERPVVLWNSFSVWSEAWEIPGSETYIGALIQDAGGQIALSDEVPSGNTRSLSFEVVYEAALDADIWVANAFGVNDLDGLLASDARYADFDAVASGNVWNNELDVNVNSGNNFYELGVTNPHLVLQDLVAIFHPELLPEHEFHFHNRLQPAG